MPALRTRQVLTNGVPGAKAVLSGTVTSATQRAPRVQPASVVTGGGEVSSGGATVASEVGGMADGVVVAPAAASGVDVAVTTTVATGPQASAESSRPAASSRGNERLDFIISTSMGRVVWAYLSIRAITHTAQS